MRDEFETGKTLFLIALVILILYALAAVATSVVGIAAAGGTIYGGGSAIKNYIKAFKKNVIDSNQELAE